MIKLGQKAQDKITLFSGILVSRITYLFGCDQYGISPQVQDGKLGDTMYFDEGRIQIIGNGILPEEVQVEKNGGVNRDCPR